MARCMNPITLGSEEKKDGRVVPCGKCENCLKARASAWSFRLMQEQKRSRSSYFVTLTYDTDHVCITRNGFLSLEKPTVQRFFKRLRKQQFGSSCGDIKYYCVGEYGGRFMRPHFHVILFNAQLELLVGSKMAWHINRRNIPLDGKIQFDCSLWPLGHITIGEVTAASVGYTLKYISKPSKIPLHRNDDRLPEFSLMSKGLGIDYLTQAMCRWHKSDLDGRMYCVLQDGKKISMPRYYKDKLYTESEREHIKLAFMYQRYFGEKTDKRTARERGEALFDAQARIRARVKDGQKF